MSLRAKTVFCLSPAWVTGALALCLSSFSGCQRGAKRSEAIEKARAQANQAAKAEPSAPTKDKKKAADAPAPTQRSLAAIEVADCESLVSRICAELGESHLGCTLSREKLPAVGDAECKSLGTRYGALIADLKIRSDIRKDPSEEMMLAMMQEGSPIAFGKVDAPVQIVEFLDFECSACAEFAPQVQAIRKKAEKGGSWEGEVRYVVRMNPLDMHPDAPLAAQAAMAASMQGKYWPYHDLLFENQADLRREKLLEMAKMVKLNMKKFKKDLDSDAVKAIVARDMALAKKVVAPATPSFFVNNKRVNPGVFEVTVADAVAKVSSQAR